MGGVGGFLEQFDLIPRVGEGTVIPQRSHDGYINATALCQSVGKTFSDYRRLQSTTAFLEALVHETGTPVHELIHSISGGHPKQQGTWVHPHLAVNLAQWLSPTFAVKVSQWVSEWMSGTAPSRVMPAHILRYELNRAKVPHTHFSMLNEITLSLIAPLESSGYTMPDSLMPDISEGRMFCKWLRENRGVEPNTFDTYVHEFADGRRVAGVKLYPIEYYEDFRKHFHETWLPMRAQKYFAERGSPAAALIETLFLPSP